jgi:pimeloyl-ACP methyl ester carboxylesterase
VALRRNAAEPLTRLVRFEATDGVELSGLLFEPRRATQRAIIFLHGTGGATVFESKRTNRLARAFLDAGVAYFPFNNRGAHLVRWLRSRTRRIGGGMAFEKIRDCVFDIDGAARELRRRGYRELWLIGHSTGANKIAVYDSRKPRNPFRGYVLLAGGDDTGILWQELGDRRFGAALEKARAMIKAGRGEEFVPRTVSTMLLSWRAFLDTANPDGDYNVFPFLEIMRGVRLSKRARFRHVRAIRKPALFVYGDRDEYLYGDPSRCVSILADALGPKPNIELALMRDADHGFSGREAELAELIVRWMG